MLTSELSRPNRPSATDSCYHAGPAYVHCTYPIGADLGAAKARSLGMT